MSEFRLEQHEKICPLYVEDEGKSKNEHEEELEEAFQTILAKKLEEKMEKNSKINVEDENGYSGDEEELPGEDYSDVGRKTFKLQNADKIDFSEFSNIKNHF